MTTPTSRPALLDAWQQLVYQLHAAGAAVLDPDRGLDATELAEGARFLSSLTSAALDMFVQHGQVERPAFVRLMSAERKFFGDNPDATYDFAAVDGRHRYLLTGVRGSSEYLACCVYGRDVDGNATIVANVSDRDLVVDADADGRFALYLSATPPPPGTEATWVPLTPECDSAVVRQYFLDPTREVPASLAITCLDAPRRVTLQGDDLQRRLAAAGHLVASGAELTAVAADVLATQPNALTIDSRTTDVAAFYPTPDNQYLAGWFHLEPGEALVVEGTPPDARYWSLLLMTRWMESLDQLHETSLLNNADVSLEVDGSYRVVVAHEDPGEPNWLSTGGRTSGYLMFRWMQADDVATPSVRVVHLTDL